MYTLYKDLDLFAPLVIFFQFWKWVQS